MELSSIGNRMEQETACGSVPLPSANRAYKMSSKIKSVIVYHTYFNGRRILDGQNADSKSDGAERLEGRDLLLPQLYANYVIRNCERHIR